LTTTRHLLPAQPRPPASTLILAWLVFAWPAITLAQWQVIDETDVATGIQTPVAEVHNEAGYTLAIYRDRENNVLARFRLNDRLYRLHDNTCPTYQIDTRPIRNGSVSEQGCMLKPRMSEYLLGRIDENNRLVSRPLYELMNGSRIEYRYRLQAGGYGQTSFSLAGSKRTLLTVLGHNLEVVPR